MEHVVLQFIVIVESGEYVSAAHYATTEKHLQTPGTPSHGQRVCVSRSFLPFSMFLSIADGLVDTWSFYVALRWFTSYRSEGSNKDFSGVDNSGVPQHSLVH